MLSTPAIEFTSAEVASYYAARVPQLKQRRAAEWRGPCPIHGGKADSFAVDPATGHWFCHSKCAHGGDVLDLEAEMTGGDFPTRKAEVFHLVGRLEPVNGHSRGRIFENSPRSAPTKTSETPIASDAWREAERYPYTDRDGKLLFEVVRGLRSGGAKSFRQCRPDGRGGVAWNLEGVQRVPYHLPQLLKAETVFLPEGEKDVATLENWGLAASCNPGGAGSSRLYTEWADYFRGRHVVVLPDNDLPGFKHAAAVATALLGAAASVRVVELPDLPEKQDVTYWRDAGGTFERFQQLTEAVAPIDAAGLAELRARWGLADDEPNRRTALPEAADDWLVPVPLQSELPPVRSFTEDLLPEAFRPLVLDVAERMQVPVDFPAVVTVLCLAGAVNRRAVIQPKVNDTAWIVVPNLWGGIIAKPGFMKSPVIQAAAHPLTQIQAGWQHEHDEAFKDYSREKEEYELRCAAWREEFKRRAKKGMAAPERPDDEPEEPKLRRLIVNDATFEALHQTMSENPAGILVIRDELTGWWSQLDRSGREGERAFSLQAWNGDTGHTIDRIGRGTIRVEACCMSMLGGIQPGRLRSYLVDALEDGPSNDGLIQRFQLLVWPDTAPDWQYVDRAPDADLEQYTARVFHELVAMDPENPLRFHFDADAQELFIAWLEDLEQKIRRDELHPALISHLSKYRSLMPSLALLFELAERRPGGEPTDTVTLKNAQRAAAWCEYLESHAKRVYSCIVTPQLRAARELADKIKHRKVGTDGFFSCRDVYLKGWTGLDSPEAARQAADVLQDAGWIRPANGESSDPLGRGRPSNRYEVNPGVWR